MISLLHQSVIRNAGFIFTERERNGEYELLIQCPECGTILGIWDVQSLEDLRNPMTLVAGLKCLKCNPPEPVRVRPSFEEIHMRMALLVSSRSTCKRLNVGCVVASSDFRKILAMGYNGNASGLPNQCDSDEPGKCGCIHAEQNAVINCDAPRETGKIVFTTHLPCVMCAKFMVNLGNVEKVIYHTDYRIKDGLDVLDKARIEWQQFELSP